jgi:DnaJ-class molecular chaperone
MLVELSNSEIEMILEWYGYYQDEERGGYGTSETDLDLVDKLQRLRQISRPTSNIICYNCNGTGKVQQTDIDWDECRTCNGTGNIERSTSNTNTERAMKKTI